MCSTPAFSALLRCRTTTRITAWSRARFLPAWLCCFIAIRTLEERSKGFGRIAGACLALAMYSMCLAVSSTRGETHLACPRRCCWCALCGWAGSFAILLHRVRRSQLMSSALSRHAYGYWLGSPTDNAAAGISVG